MNKANKTAFINAYMECALWASNTQDYELTPEDYQITDSSELAPETKRKMIRDCLTFIKHNGEDIEKTADKGMYSSSYNAFNAAGQDYWLTRCGHGAGFWDRGLGELGSKLSEAAQLDGNVDLYVGEDGLVYQ